MNQDLAIQVESVSKAFKLPHQRHNSVKSLFISLFRGKRSFEKQKVLDNVSINIKHGEFFGIVGKNGQGKSTLLKLLAGIYYPDMGQIHINGKLTPFIELGVGFNPNLTGRENVFLNGALLGFSQKEMDAMYDDIVEFAELEKFMDQRLKNYSSGMQVRLAFSIAIRAKSDILLLDEVLAVGDAAFQQKCYNHFEELKSQNRTVVFVSHDMGAVRRFCTRAAYVSEGKITHMGLPSEVADMYTVDNIDGGAIVEQDENSEQDEKKPTRNHTISAKITDQTEKTLKIEFNYSSRYKDALYIGIAVIKDGISVAEITTPSDMKLDGKGKVSYALDLSPLNPAVYRIGFGLFKLTNRELLATTNKKCQFVIKGQDITRGAALKLEHNWKLE